MTNQPIEFQGRREPEGWRGWLMAYTVHMEAKQLAENTISTYETALRMFGTFCQGLGATDPRDVKRSHVELYFSRMARDGRASGAKQRFRQLRPFFRWLATETGEEDAFENVGSPKGHQPETPTLEPEQVQRILAYRGMSDFTTYRNRAIVRILVDTGMRVSELCGLERKHMDGRARTLLITTTKNHKQRTVPYGHRTSDAIKTWLHHRPEHEEPEGHDRLFTTKWGKPLNRYMVRDKIVPPMAHRAGLKNVTPHVFRHTFAHLALLNGMSELDVMRIGGWSSQTMLRRYGSMLAEKRAKTAHDRYGPGERI